MDMYGNDRPMRRNIALFLDLLDERRVGSMPLQPHCNIFMRQDCGFVSTSPQRMRGSS